MNRAQGEERMQRIRIGLTGLAFVFLLVLLGTAISRSGEDSRRPDCRRMKWRADENRTSRWRKLASAPGDRAGQ